MRMGILAEAIAERGHNVTWWTSTYDHFGKYQHQDSTQSIHITKNYRIFLLYAPGYRTNASFSRALHDSLIVKQFNRAAPHMEKPDIIVASYPTPALALAAVNYGNRLRIPVVVDVRDLWPEAILDAVPTQVRWLGNWAARILDRQNQVLFRKADAITAISPSYLRWALKQAGRMQRATDAVFFMGYPQRRLKPQGAEQTRANWLDRGVKPDSFVCCFFGTLGRHFDLMPVLQVAREREQAGDSRFQFLICGPGDQLEYYRHLSSGLNSVLFPGWVDLAHVTTLMEISAVGLAPYSTTAKMSLPNKPFEYMSAGLPILSSLRGELERILSEHDCGLTYDNCAGAFLTALEVLASDPERRQQMGQNARRLFEAKFAESVVYPEMIHHLERLARKE